VRSVRPDFDAHISTSEYSPTQYQAIRTSISSNQQIIGGNSQDEIFTRHLNTPHRETVDDGCSYRYQFVGVSRGVFPGYAALRL
jgi:hypothetical protein